MMRILWTAATMAPKFMLSALAAMALGLYLLSGAPADAQGRYCGIKPVKPITPIGCRDLVAVCHCDTRGQNCGWTWQCVR